MKAFHVLLAAMCAKSALGSAGAGGWEAVVLYYTYRMDFESGGTTMGPGCTGSHAKKGCNFPEFVDFYQEHQTTIREGKARFVVGKFKKESMPSDIDKDNPDPEKASKIMEWEGAFPARCFSMSSLSSMHRLPKSQQEPQGAQISHLRRSLQEGKADGAPGTPER
jgi:hypothetical protein